MSYANGTQFYNLPQTVGTDKRDWFDTNQAFADVDAALHTAVTGQAADAEAISTINAKLLDDEADIAALQTTSGTHTTQIATLQTTVNAQAPQIADVRQDSEDMICAYNEGAAETSTHAYEIGDYFIYNDVLYKATAAIAIGDTIVPNTNCSATNATTEIAQLNSDLANINNNITIAQGLVGPATVTIPTQYLTGNYIIEIDTRVLYDNVTFTISKYINGSSLRTDGTHNNLIHDGSYISSTGYQYCEYIMETNNAFHLSALLINGDNVRGDASTYIHAMQLK